VSWFCYNVHDFAIEILNFFGVFTVFVQNYE